MALTSHWDGGEGWGATGLCGALRPIAWPGAAGGLGGVGKGFETGERRGDGGWIPSVGLRGAGGEGL